MNHVTSYTLISERNLVMLDKFLHENYINNLVPNSMSFFAWKAQNEATVTLVFIMCTCELISRNGTCIPKQFLCLHQVEKWIQALSILCITFHFRIYMMNSHM